MTLAGERACGVAEACAQLAQRARRREACLRRLVGVRVRVRVRVRVGVRVGVGIGGRVRPGLGLGFRLALGLAQR